MEYFKWENTYCINVNGIDEQHKTLIKILDNLYNSVVTNELDREDNLEKTLESLFDYIYVHFQTEEEYMENYDYPDFHLHRIEHEDFVKNMINFQNDYNKGKKDIDKMLLDYLKDWLIKHILATDKRLGIFLNRKNIF